MVKNQPIGRKETFQLFWKEKSETEKKKVTCWGESFHARIYYLYCRDKCPWTVRKWNVEYRFIVTVNTSGKKYKYRENTNKIGLYLVINIKELGKKTMIHTK